MCAQLHWRRLAVPYLTTFAGFFVYAKVRKRRNRGKRHPSRPRPSLSMSPMTQSAAGVSSTQSATLVDHNSRGAVDDRGARRSMAASPFGYSTSGGASGTPPGTITGNSREGLDERTRRPEQSYSPRREPQTRWAPPPRPQTRPSQPARQTSDNHDEPRFRFVAHPYQNRPSQESGTSLPTDAPLDLALPVSSPAVGNDPPQSSTSPPPSGHSTGIQSNSTEKSEEKKAASSQQGPSRVEPKPTNTLNAPPMERRLSTSFLMFDDVETPTSSNVHLPALYQSPATLYQSPALPSSTGHTPNLNLNPNPDANANANSGGTAAPRFITVVAPYRPLLSDELPLRVGDVARLLAEFDDGWCIVERNGVTGAVPKVCLRERPQS